MNKIIFIKSNERKLDNLSSVFQSPHFNVEILEKEKSYLTKYRKPNLVIVDSPINQNLHLYKRLREEGIQGPIIAFSKADTIESRVKALLHGADDVIDDQIDPDELNAKIFCLLRRPGIFATETIAIADLKINLSERCLVRAGISINLRRKEFDLLLFLIRNKGKVLSRYNIFEHVWLGKDDSYTNTVDVHIRHLRKKLDDPFQRKLIKTIYGIGYKFED